MAVTVYWVEYITGETPGGDPHDTHSFSTGGDTPPTVTSATNINLGNSSERDLTPSASPIAAGSNSFAKYFRLQFSGSFSQISNAKLWKSAGVYVTDEYLWFSGNVDYAPPAITAAITDLADGEWTNYKAGGIRIPTSQPSNNNVVLYSGATASAGSTSAVLPVTAEIKSSPGYYSGSRSATMVFQLTTSASSAAGAVNQKTISLTYDRT